VSDGESGLNEFIKFSFRSLSEMEPSGVSVEITKSCINKDQQIDRVDPIEYAIRGGLVRSRDARR
jgi:hypothetical protein